MVITPWALWKDYDRKLLPLQDSVVSVYSDATATNKLIYFNGEASAPGCSRIFARLVEPLNSNGCMIIIMCEPMTDVLKIDVSTFTAAGFSALIVDYAGDYLSKTRFTIYPRALSFANFCGEDTMLALSENPTKTCWYIWETCALRAITYAEKLGYSKISMLGLGTGCAAVWKTLSIDTSLVCGVSVFSSGFNYNKITDVTNKSFLTFKACLDSASYAPQLKNPIFQIVTSNDQNGSFDRMNDIFSSISRDDCLLSIDARGNRVLSDVQRNNILLFFTAHMVSGEPLPTMPTLTASSSEHSLYYELSCSSLPLKAAMYVSHATKNPAFRNWSERKLETVGDGNYIARVSTSSPTENLHAFCVVQYPSGLTLATPELTKIPASLGVVGAPLIKKRLIYDSDMGLDDWLILDQYNKSQKLCMRVGAFGISGIENPSQISTFKLGDETYRGARDSVLQLIIFSPLSQIINFFITIYENNVLKNFSCAKSISPTDNWAKFTLSSNDFKSPSGAAFNWENIVIFSVSSASPLLINSILWV